jgi:hypothetical protein
MHAEFDIWQGSWFLCKELSAEIVVGKAVKRASGTMQILWLDLWVSTQSHIGFQASRREALLGSRPSDTKPILMGFKQNDQMHSEHTVQCILYRMYFLHGIFFQYAFLLIDSRLSWKPEVRLNSSLVIPRSPVRVFSIEKQQLWTTLQLL